MDTRCVLFGEMPDMKFLLIPNPQIILLFCTKNGSHNFKLIPRQWLVMFWTTENVRNLDFNSNFLCIVYIAVGPGTPFLTWFIIILSMDK